METVKPTKNREYSPTPQQWHKIVTETAFFAEGIDAFSRVVKIDFNKSRVQLPSRYVYFDGLNESEYVHVCNGGYFEEAEEIVDEERV